MKSNNPYTIQEAYRYLANARETIGKSPVEYGRYVDSKYVSEAAGIAYLSALKAIRVFLFSRGVEENNLPKSIEKYREMIHKKMPHNGKLMAALNTCYENLHRFAYYDGGTDVQMVKSGFDSCKKIIQMIDDSLGMYGRDNVSSQVNEPDVKYLKTSKKIKKNLHSINKYIYFAANN